MGNTHSKEKEEQLTYIFVGALLPNAAPGLLAPILELGNAWSFFGFYTWPAEVTGQLLKINVSSWFITVPFWTIIGGFAGYVIWRLKNHYLSRAELKLP
jgi:hypothetical protein